MKTKICTKCKQRKPLNEFSSNKRTKDKLKSWCKFCNNQEGKKYREDHKLEIQKRKKKYCENHKLELKKYREDHRLEIKKRTKKWQEDHKLEIQKRKKKYRLEHKEESNKYERNKRKTDIRYKITGSLRSRIYAVIKGNTKSLSTMFLIGCEIDYLLFHLQSQFQPGMSWDNHGRGRDDNGLKEWQIDHIKPCASFDLSKPEEQRKCFHYTNLQPLWAKDNLIKSDQRGRAIK